MAEKKKNTIRKGSYAKTSQNAGKSKSDYSGRRSQNAKVKDGTVRLGKGGKYYNVWDEKSGRWKRGKKATVKTDKPKVKKSNIKDTKASRVGGYTPGTKSQGVKDGWWSSRRYPATYR